MNNKNKKQEKKFERTTQEQLHYYIQFQKQHPELKPGTPKAITRDLWNELAITLNAMRGPSRTPMKWKENFSHWRKQKRYRAKKALNANSCHDQESYDDVFCDSELITKNEVNIIKECETSIVQTLGFSDGTCETNNEIHIDNNIIDPLISMIPDAEEFLLTNSRIKHELEISDDDDDSDDDGDNDDDDGNESSKSITCNESDKSVSRLNSNQSSTIKRPNTPDKIVELLVESIKQREMREERAIEQQRQMTEALKAMTRAIVKLNDKLSTKK